MHWTEPQISSTYLDDRLELELAAKFSLLMPNSPCGSSLLTNKKKNNQIFITLINVYRILFKTSNDFKD